MKKKYKKNHVYKCFFQPQKKNKQKEIVWDKPVSFWSIIINYFLDHATIKKLNGCILKLKSKLAAFYTQKMKKPNFDIPKLAFCFSKPPKPCFLYSETDLQNQQNRISVFRNQNFELWQWYNSIEDHENWKAKIITFKLL